MNEAIGRASLALDPLVTSLKVLFSASEDSEREEGSLAPVDPAKVLAAGERMLALLSEFDPGVEGVMKECRTELRGLFSREAWAELEKLVGEYAFEDAERKMKEALNNLPQS